MRELFWQIFVAIPQEKELFQSVFLLNHMLLVQLLIFFVLNYIYTGNFDCTFHTLEKQRIDQ